MFNNVGKKLNSLAMVMFVVLAIISFIAGILVLSINDDFIAPGLLIIFCGPLVALFFSWLLYGFGELIDKVTDIERSIRRGEHKSEAQTKFDSARINRIEKLRSQGLITEEEYKKAISNAQ